MRVASTTLMRNGACSQSSRETAHGGARSLRARAARSLGSNTAVGVLSGLAAGFASGAIGGTRGAVAGGIAGAIVGAAAAIAAPGEADPNGRPRP